MTLEIFIKDILGADASKYTQQEIESLFELSNKIFEVGFSNFITNRSRKDKISQ